MLKQKVKKLGLLKNARFSAAAIVVVVAGGLAYGGLVRADSFDEQIKALQQQNASHQAASDQLAAQASSYQDAIDKLDQQINSLQQAIVANQQKSAELQAQITQAEADLVQEKKVLGENIKTMYLEGQISTLEILASSNNLSDFVNKQEYRNSVQSKVKITLDKINALKVQLEQQQRELEVAIADQKNQQSQLSSTQYQQNQMLAYTEGQKAAYDSQIKSNKSKIADLRRQQQAANARFFSGGSYISAGNKYADTYPAGWRNTYQDSLIDSWGMYNRECVSYTAWMVYSTGRYMPYWGGVGNANQWDEDADAAGIPADSNPRPGDVAIKNSYPYGHAMYVREVNDDGSIYVSQYNADLTGHYSEAYISPGAAASLVYIHF